MKTFAAQPDLVLFDLDDTLCDYAGARRQRLQIAFRTAAEVAGVELPADLAPLIAESIALNQHGTEHFPQLLAGYGITNPTAVQQAQRWYQVNRFHSLALFHDAVQTVQLVRAALPGRRIGLVTNGPTETQRAKMQLLEIEQYVDFAIISEEFGAWKPDPAIFEEALKRGNAAPEQAVFIGDSCEHDMLGALATGIAAIWMNPHDHPWRHPRPAPDLIVRNLGDVRDLLTH